ncbi:Uu.00g132810.m01.CDS01 [Anthostomella pinea]|uniref:Uu.00g132810.m01.CDS01 n=1 Tax=Anthostomella pinea TaxID=933095 RepID=A0AAI8YKC7_9PEZI|nr:Uu.00g132810.m01.CDS01 [Anthostomella pinea]
MLTPETINILSYFYALGNTPAVCLTQSLPPGSPADILLLGCGDVRNILFTSHVDVHRQLDLTCCDFQKAVLARNILLLSLIIDDSGPQCTKILWGLYYHFHLDDNCHELLRSQSQKLHSLSDTMEAWHNSKYGPVLKFCDSATLADVRTMWHFYITSREGSEKSHFEAHFNDNLEETRDIEVDLKSRARARRPNPMFVTDDGPLLHYGTDPLLGFHLAAAYAPLQAQSRLFTKSVSPKPQQRAVETAQLEFSNWVDSFSKRLKSVTIRFFSGNALAFSHSLLHRRVNGGSTGNWYRDRYRAETLKLNGPEFTSGSAPLTFDIIDRSNLCDHVGGLNLLTAVSPLLRNCASSAVYTEILHKRSESPQKAFDHILCGHTPTVSLLLGLFPVDYWTNVLP